ncbi:MAG: hypothetical protein HY069_00800 [Chlamydiia bacterium]|nr:hypothetical protein [Chlamydiia bacterium]
MIDSHEYWVCFRRSEKPIPEYVTLIYDQGKIFVQNGQDKKSSSVPTRIDGYDDARKNYVPISEILLRNYSQQILECVAEVFEEKHPIASQQQESASAASAATPAPKPTAPSAPATSPTPIATPTGPSAPREDIWTAVKPTPTGPSAPPVPGPAAARDVPPPAYQEPSVPPYQEPARPQYVTAPLRVANSRIITDWYADYDAERYLQNQVNVAVYCEHPDVEQIKGLGYIYFRDAGGQLVRYTYYKNEFGEEYAFVKMQTSNLEIEQHLTKCYGSIAQLLAEGRAEAAGKGYTPEIFRSPAF